VTSELMTLELRRGRWRRARQALHLLDPSTEDFGDGGLARFVVERSARLLILPADPEAILIEFDEDLWSWWLQDRLDPVTDMSMSWGTQHKPSSTAVVRFDSYREEGWESYLALHRHGGLELELGANATYSTRDKQRGFRLIYMVGHIWGALHLYREVVERFGIEGPWEVSLALQQTAGAMLGNLGHGWAPPEASVYNIPTCLEPGALLRQEIDDWPSGDEIRSLAFTVGGWVEDLWGSRDRRFLARGGDLTGLFDSRQYSQ
jgi:hypothetical protein